MISKETALDIALAYREIEAAEKLLEGVSQAVDRFIGKDIRDVFGRRVDGLQLGVPSGDNGHRLFNVPYSMAKPIIETHIAAKRAVIAVLTEKAQIEIGDVKSTVSTTALQRLVTAAREAAFSDEFDAMPETARALLRELDEASEGFADSFLWEDEPAPADAKEAANV